MIFPSMTIVKVIAVQIVGAAGCRRVRGEPRIVIAGWSDRCQDPSSGATTLAASQRRHVRCDHAGGHGRPRRGERRQAGVDRPADAAGAERPGRRLHLVRRDLRDDGERRKRRHHSADGAAAFSAGLPYGVVRLLTGLVFSVGLILVVVGGAELFTGNNLIVMAWASGKVKTRAIAAQLGRCFHRQFRRRVRDGGSDVLHDAVHIRRRLGRSGCALTTAKAKRRSPSSRPLTLGIMCNALVCLAVWMCYGARTTMDRIVTIVPPIAAFVAAGFEHSIANIYFIPMGLFIKAGAPDSFWNVDRQDASGFSRS